MTDTNTINHHGYSNYETWNVALWIKNDHDVYLLARSASQFLDCYETFLNKLRVEFGSMKRAERTGDGVYWAHKNVNREEIVNLMRGLK